MPTTSLIIVYNRRGRNWTRALGMNRSQGNRPELWVLAGHSPGRGGCEIAKIAGLTTGQPCAIIHLYVTGNV